MSALLTLFSLNGRSHALPVERVVEALRMVALAPVPDSPAWHAGMLNLRGDVLPVIDLRELLELAPEAPGLSTRILVVAVGDRRAGLLVDDVTGVRSADEAEVDASGATRYVSAVTRLGEEVVVVLDADGLLAALAPAPQP